MKDYIYFVEDTVCKGSFDDGNDFDITFFESSQKALEYMQEQQRHNIGDVYDRYHLKYHAIVGAVFFQDLCDWCDFEEVAKVMNIDSDAVYDECVGLHQTIAGLEKYSDTCNELMVDWLEKNSTSQNEMAEVFSHFDYWNYTEILERC